MGIFKKSKDMSDFELERGTAGEYDFEESSPVAEPAPRTPAAPPKAAIKQSYGIEDAIALMRKLPNVNSEITITVVKKTLESANIQVEEIISDAARKESQIEERTEQLSKEISELQDRIARLNGEISELTSDLKETTKVKNLLLGASEPERAQAKPAEAPKKPKEEAAPQTGTSAASSAPGAPHAGAQPKSSVAMGEKP